MPLPQVGNCNYTPLQQGTNTSGTFTQTVNQGQSGVPGQGQQGNLPSTFGVLYGASVLQLGTSTTTGTATGGGPVGVAAYDLIPPSGLGTNTATVTNLLMQGTQSGPGVLQAGVSGVGVRYNGALVFVVTGGPTFGAINALWD